MRRLATRIDTRSANFRTNREATLAALTEIGRLQQQVIDGGGARYVARHRERNKLLARERIERLIDPDTALLELSPLAGWGTGDPLGAGIVTAIGIVAGSECMIIANDPTVRGGAMSPSTITKNLRALEIARVNRMPLINLTESGGADLAKQADIFVPGGAAFKEISRLSRNRVPTIAVVFGSSTAGGAYVPGMSDFTILVQDRAKVFLGGPPLVKMATNEIADEEELGGALMHARTSGLADYLAHDELDGLRLARGIMRVIAVGSARRAAATGVAEPLYPTDDLLGIPAADPRLPYDIREIIARIVDGSDFDEFKTLYGPQLVCGWAELNGRTVGILGNNGILFSQEAQKGAQFIQLANELGVPLVFIHNITGFMVGTRYEQGGIIKDGAKLINAVSNSVVPHLVLMVGASYGAGNYAMSGRAYDPRFVFSWPSHRIAVMGGAQLAGVISIIRRNAAIAAGQAIDDDREDAARAELEAQVERESTALFATGRVWDDGIIDPRDTRTVLGIALSVIEGRPNVGDIGYATFRM